MSKKKTKTSNTSTIIITSIIFCCVAASSFLWVKFFSTKNEDFSTETDEFSTDNSTTFSTENIKIEQKSSTYNENDEEEKKIIQYEGKDPNTLEILTGNISTNRVQDNNYILRISIDQFLTIGACELKMTSQTQSYNETTLILPTATSSTCEGFDIPIEKLGTGLWQIEINLSSENKKGTITGEINI